jgi:hypothetical protein
MSGAIPLLPNTPSWRGAQLKEKHRDKFTFYLSKMDDVRYTNSLLTTDLSEEEE